MYQSRVHGPCPGAGMHLHVNTQLGVICRPQAWRRGWGALRLHRGLGAAWELVCGKGNLPAGTLSLWCHLAQLSPKLSSLLSQVSLKAQPCWSLE